MKEPKEARAVESGPEGSATEVQPGFDARLGRLESIVGALEEGGLELEDALERYREGVDLLKGCREELGSYRRQVEELTGEAEASLRPFDGDPDVPSEA